MVDNAGESRAVDVEVQNDHLERLEQSKTYSAFAELIWNALDADATEVRVAFERAGAQDSHISSIVVSDNGVGIGGEGYALSPDELFKNLGGSWKKAKRRTSSGRAIHGQVGEGRFKAFSLGDVIEWKTKALINKHLVSYSVSRIKGSKRFQFTPAEPAEGETGTRVTVTSVRDQPAPDTDGVRKALTREFALYLQQYPKVKVIFDGQPLESKALVEVMRNLPSVKAQLGETDEHGQPRVVEVKTTIIEWNVKMDRALYLCDEEGFALFEMPAGVQAPGLTFTVYAKSAYFRELKNKGLLELALAPDREKLVEEVKDRVREYVRQRIAEEAAGSVDQWRKEEVYPYEGEPIGPTETVERQVFDILAINVSRHLPEFEQTPPKHKKLTFQLVKQAIESNPSSLQTIMGEVLGLPKEKQDELAELLKQTTLSAIIKAANVVTGRLNFLKGLEGLLFDPEHKHSFLERDHLHRMLAVNTWIFGEEYNLTVDDESLTEALKRHIELLKDDEKESIASDGNGSADAAPVDPVLLPDGKTGRLDLMLSRSVPQANALQREHLVIELKRRSQPINMKVLTQIQGYAMAVANDPRFHGTTTKWRFIAVSNEMDLVARRSSNQRHKPPGLFYDDGEQPLSVWAYTWGDLLQRAVARMEFFRKELDYSATRDSSREHLIKLYASYLPKTMTATSDEEPPPAAPDGTPPSPAETQPN